MEPLKLATYSVTVQIECGVSSVDCGEWSLKDSWRQGLSRIQSEVEESVSGWLLSMYGLQAQCLWIFVNQTTLNSN